MKNLTQFIATLSVLSAVLLTAACNAVAMTTWQEPIFASN